MTTPAKAAKAAILTKTDERMRALLGAATTVQEAAVALASDRDGLAWANTGYSDGDARCSLRRITSLPADDILTAMYAIRADRGRAAEAAHFAAVTAADNAAAVDRAAPGSGQRGWVPDQFED